MQISTQDQQALILSLSSAIRDARTAPWGTYFDEDFEMPSISEVLSKRLKKYLDRGGLQQFSEDCLQKQILESGFDHDGNEYLLREIDAFSDHVELAKTVVDNLKSLPYKYNLIVRGPHYISAGLASNPFNIRISDRLSLVSSDILATRMSFTSGNTNIDEWCWNDSLLPAARRLNPHHLYFVFAYTGYIGIGRNSKAVEVLSDEMRAFYGACIAHKVIQAIGYHREQSVALIFMSCNKNGFLTPHGTMASDIHRATYFYATSPLSKAFRKQSNLEVALSAVISLFNCSNSTRLKTAAMWLLRAHLSLKPLDQVLESAITLEVLLGDRDMSDKIGLTRLMANRCAYALGKADGERQDIMNFFGDFYKLRSDIVHTGRLSMDEDEEELVSKGIKLASDMLVYEQRLSC